MPESEITVPRGAALSDVGLAALSDVERRIVYACGAWMALADDVQTKSESLVLRRLCERLGLSADLAHALDELAHHVRTREAGAPWRELDRLVVSVARLEPRRHAAA